MDLTLKEIIKKQIKDRIAAHNQVVQTSYGTIIRPKRLYGFKLKQFATLQIENPRTPAELIKRFYKLNSGLNPQSHSFRKNIGLGAFEPSHHVFIFYSHFHITVVKGSNSIHNVHLYYRDADKNPHWIGSTTLKAEIFSHTPKILQRLLTCINLKKFQVAIHQLESEIPQ